MHPSLAEQLDADGAPVLVGAHAATATQLTGEDGSRADFVVSADGVAAGDVTVIAATNVHAMLAELTAAAIADLVLEVTAADDATLAAGVTMATVAGVRAFVADDPKAVRRVALMASRMVAS